MGPAHQGQVGQVGGAAMQPVAQMVGFAPGRGPVAPGERTAAVADHQGGPLGGGDDPAGPAHLQQLGGGATKGRREPARRHRSWAARPPSPPGSWWGGPVAGDQDPGDGAVAGQPPAGLGVQRPGPAGLPAQRHRDRGGCPGPPSPAAGAGPHRSGGAGRLPGGGGPARPGHRPVAGHRSGCRRRWCGRANGSRAASRVWPASGSSSPLTATMPSQVGDSHRPRCCWRPFGLGRRRRRGRPPAADARWPAAAGVGPAAGPPPAGPVRPRRRVWSGRSWVPAASTWAWAADSSPSARAWPVWVRGPRYSARAVRTKLAAVPALMWSRWRSQAAVEPAWKPCSAPAAPRASRPASSPSHWPSRRSTSCRSRWTRSPRARVGQAVRVLVGQALGARRPAPKTPLVSR